jgi:DNA-binding CsgD family transcriptional regulator
MPSGNRCVGTGASKSMPAGAVDPFGKALTRREKEIAALIGVGKGNKEIAERFRCSPRTVETHVHNILEKRGLKNRNEICAWWHTQGHPNGTSPDKTAR